jgi:hypothetical protein
MLISITIIDIISFLISEMTNQVQLMLISITIIDIISLLISEMTNQVQ